ncbi:Solute-binding protein [Polaromonas vacuolata]|uniref:Solute-binding protein n=1 Tax=Polaromonas vacuolata TaxID=37448 RepID=A0A6H2HA33_9BURK|nr:TRAP transporter substrate-binding protein [Polaromonas vacuolata]QJC56454.1 Solute-binding protein [Polaromonas vacuolata]
MKLLSMTLACAATLATPFAHAQANWDLPTGYASNTFQTENVQQFADDVAKATGGKLKITVHSGASLYKMPEIKRAVQTGQTQAGEFILSGLSNENPLFGIDSIPFLATSYDQAQKLYTAAKPATEKLLADQGMKLLFSVPWPGQSLYSVKPITTMDDFKGTKMRAYNPATTKIAQLAKAQPVTIQLAELGQALATGAAENFLTSSASGMDSKLYEQTKYFYIVNAWLPRNATVVNKKVFEALDKTTQDAVLAAAKAAEARGWAASRSKDAAYVKDLTKNGMTVAQPTEAVRAGLSKIGDTMIQDWLKSAGSEGKTIIDAYKKM